MIFSPSWRRRAALLIGAASLALSACAQQEEAAPTAVPEVSVVKVQPSQVDIADELPGRVVAFRVAEIRPQVGGVIQRRMFEQGSEVRAGQALFQIDAAPFRADVASADAAVRRAQAVAARARTQERRLAPLVEADAISGQTYDDAVTARDQAMAELAQSRAQLRRSNVDLGFATLRSPISGRIDQAVFTEGALAVAGDTQPLATVQQIDRVYIDVRQPAARLEALREAARAGEGNAGAEVEIRWGNDRIHPVRGRMLFSGISVDPGTGDVIARVEVANPDRTLLPGMFVRARLPRLSLPAALVVPRQAVTRDAAGKEQVSVVDAQGKVHSRRVTTGDERNGQIVITEGLKSGDVVIVEGQDRVAAGATVKPVAWRNPAAAAPAGPAAAKR
ncbi:efflux RND transporter periplasmic adaptor subunit [Altererythrobacter xixiisoli]|uniref:Efflux RND transporter periplasmic adaptor subunit n=1 Tax=Croceibacterium xixiisoli TaxID=1476466 RepID=A0A6I4TXD9_9SPHN|nr:efflux RND transporter periplasmic adaptor subunit [Croceibacterium xixiisoli]MXO99487.1 efflux RND transporter periplasmic adaptor subunit [Croceibacterium xixiisoli]